VKYDNSFIPKCPFYFTVSRELTIQVKNQSLETPELYDQNSNSNSITLLNGSSERLNSLASNKLPFIPGRGRIIRQLVDDRPRNGRNSKQSSPIGTSASGIASRLTTPNTIQTSQSQKRKSPLISDLHDQSDVEMRDVAAKLKRVIVDERNNEYYQYGSSANVYTIEQHLQKYSSIRFGDIPPIKCQFICKYKNDLSFPIGITIFMRCNWAIVADSGNHCVKIFNSLNGQLIQTLGAGKGDTTVVFRRPSAVHADDNYAELYVKDDKEIQVFDLNNDFRLLRRFGTSLLVRPYGSHSFLIT
jgi:hypothetical protein